jgi:hypothetical protein
VQSRWQVRLGGEETNISRVTGAIAGGDRDCDSESTGSLPKGSGADAQRLVTLLKFFGVPVTSTNIKLKKPVPFPAGATARAARPRSSSRVYLGLNVHERPVVCRHLNWLDFGAASGSLGLHCTVTVVTVQCRPRASVSGKEPFPTSPHLC